MGRSELGAQVRKIRNAKELIGRSFLSISMAQSVERQRTIKTHRNFVRGLTKKDQTFSSATFRRFLPVNSLASSRVSTSLAWKSKPGRPPIPAELRALDPRNVSRQFAMGLVHQVRGWYSGVELKMSRPARRRGGSVSKSIRDRRATQPPAHFQLNPLGRAALAILGRCSLDPYQSRYGPSLAPSKIANSATAPLYQPRTWCTSVA